MNLLLFDLSFIAEALNQIVQIANHRVKQLVHQFWFNHFRDVDDNPLTSASPSFREGFPIDFLHALSSQKDGEGEQEESS